eukprot:2872072-Pleurochrysis_carterae.AAC.2
MKDLTLISLLTILGRSFSPDPGDRIEAAPSRIGSSKSGFVNILTVTSLAIRTTCNGGTGQRAAVSINQGGARPFSGTDRRARAFHAPKHIWGIDPYASCKLANV